MALPALLAAMPIIGNIADGISQALGAGPKPAAEPAPPPADNCSKERTAAAQARSQAKRAREALAKERPKRAVSAAVAGAAGLVIGGVFVMLISKKG